jgi:hypothetical protein
VFDVDEIRMVDAGMWKVKCGRWTLECGRLKVGGRGWNVEGGMRKVQ